MPSVEEVWKDPDFVGLPHTEKVKVMQHLDPDFAALPTGEQNKVVVQLAGKGTPVAAQPAQEADPNGQPVIDVTASPNPDGYTTIRANGGGTDLKSALQGGMSVAEAMNKGLIKDEYDLDRAKWILKELAPEDKVDGVPQWGRDNPNMYAARQTLANLARPTLEGVGTVGGAMLGSGAAPVAGTLAGGALGYAAGKGLADLIEGTSAAQTPAQLGVSSLKDLGTGLALTVGGEVAAPALSAVSSGIGKVAKPLLGKLSGVGPGAIDEAIKSGVKGSGSVNPLASTTGFDKALRGHITGDEIVDNARAALTTLKDQRAQAYQSKLAQVESNQAPIDMAPVRQDLTDLMRRYKVRIGTVTKKGMHGPVTVQNAIDTSRVPMGAKGRSDIEDVVNTIRNWGSQSGDNTASGLDTLKRQLDDFYSESSQARQFVAEIRNKVRDAIVRHVPEYDEMTKGYAEATKLIKDVEADLMMRKQGMSGRITADKTLRRLMSAMRDNFEMRRELVEILGNKGGEDLSGQIAGYTMNTAIPRGLAGTGPALAGQAAYAHFVNSSFWPVLAASSPRVQGEFLRVLGKGIGAAKSVSPQAVKAGVIGGGVLATDAMRGGSQQQ